MTDIRGNFDEDGESDPITVDSGAVLFVGSQDAASFGGGAVYLQAQGPDELWYRHGEAITGAAVRYIDVPVSTVVRLAIFGSVNPDLDYAIQVRMPKTRITVGS